MRVVRPILVVVGVLALLMGLLWIGQGLGFVHWPKSSFMLGEPEWAIRGAILAVAGVLLIVVNRRR